jgi:hypothetical protein
VTEVCLDQAGYDHAPTNLICLPSGTVLTYRYDGERTLIALGLASQGQIVRDHLAAGLAVWGWEVTEQSAEALRFSDEVWQGSFVIGDGIWGLTVRSE